MGGFWTKSSPVSLSCSCHSFTMEEAVVSFHSTVGHCWYTTKSDTNTIYIQWIMRWGQKPHEYQIHIQRVSFWTKVFVDFGVTLLPTESTWMSIHFPYLQRILFCNVHSIPVPFRYFYAFESTFTTLVILLLPINFTWRALHLFSPILFHTLLNVCKMIIPFPPLQKKFVFPSGQTFGCDEMNKWKTIAIPERRQGKS